MIQYFTDVAGEFKQINWLSARRAFMLTIVVIIASIVAGFVLGAIDNVFATLLKSVVI